MTTPFENVLIPKYLQDSCGICETPIEYSNESVCWVNPISRTAHKCCYEKIKHSEKQLHEYVTSLCNKIINGEDQRASWYNKCSSYARGYVREVCKGSILSYFGKNGEDKLTQVFDGIGCPAAEKYIVSHIDNVVAANLK